jgi:uncharacterized protein YdeI (YjbR/CyaY-like superfamily)
MRFGYDDEDALVAVAAQIGAALPLLQSQHAREGEGVWLVDWKTATGRARVGYDASVEEALSFGWVDSKVNALDAERALPWFAPRGPRTKGPAPNKDRVERMIAAGLMTGAGLAKVEAAKADGSWSKLDAVEVLQVHEDLAAALAAQPPAATGWDAFPRSAKRGILEWIAPAKRPGTRTARIAETARLAQRGERANQWTGPKRSPR